MHIFDIISEDAIYNIIGHIKNCWNYTYPSGAALEEAVYRGLKPYYENVRTLGGPTTIVDVTRNLDAFDIKGGKQLGLLSRMSSKSNKIDNDFIQETLPNGKKIIVKIPKSILAIVKRPNIDMKKFQSDPIKMAQKGIEEYANFADRTTKKDGCNKLYSLVVLYEEDKEKGFRSVFLTLEEFHVPSLTSADFITNKKDEKIGYLALDESNTVCYKILKFNNGSINSYKKFDCSRGILYTWTIDDDDGLIFNQEHVNKHGSLRIVS